jgi:hypothetical protein
MAGIHSETSRRKPSPLPESPTCEEAPRLAPIFAAHRNHPHAPHDYASHFGGRNPMERGNFKSTLRRNRNPKGLAQLAVRDKTSQIFLKYRMSRLSDNLNLEIAL